RNLPAAEQRHRVQPELPRRDRGELRIEVGCGGEDAADHRLRLQCVALDQRPHQLLGRLENRLSPVLLRLRRAAEREEPPPRSLVAAEIHGPRIIPEPHNASLTPPTGARSLARFLMAPRRPFTTTQGERRRCGLSPDGRKGSFRVAGSKRLDSRPARSRAGFGTVASSPYSTASS